MFCSWYWNLDFRVVNVKKLTDFAPVRWCDIALSNAQSQRQRFPLLTAPSLTATLTRTNLSVLVPASRDGRHWFDLVCVSPFWQISRTRMGGWWSVWWRRELEKSRWFLLRLMLRDGGGVHEMRRRWRRGRRRWCWWRRASEATEIVLKSRLFVFRWEWGGCGGQVGVRDCSGWTCWAPRRFSSGWRCPIPRGLYRATCPCVLGGASGWDCSPCHRTQRRIRWFRARLRLRNLGCKHRHCAEGFRKAPSLLLLAIFIWVGRTIPYWSVGMTRYAQLQLRRFQTT